MKYIKQFESFNKNNKNYNLLVALCDCYEVGSEGQYQLEELLNNTSGKISNNDELVIKIFDIVINKNTTGGHKGPLMSKPHDRVEEIRNFIRTNEPKD